MPDQSEVRIALDSLADTVRALGQRLDRLEAHRRPNAKSMEGSTEDFGFTERNSDLVKYVQAEIGGSASDIVTRALVLYLHAVQAEREHQRLAILDQDDRIVNEFRDVTGRPLTSPHPVAG